jgi:hypothetical protein
MNSITVLMLPVYIMSDYRFTLARMLRSNMLVCTAKFVTTTNKTCREKPYWTAETINIHIII